MRIGGSLGSKENGEEVDFKWREWHLEWLGDRKDSGELVGPEARPGRLQREWGPEGGGNEAWYPLGVHVYQAKCPWATEIVRGQLL